MKKTLITALMVFICSSACRANQLPVYSDDLPKDYIKKINSFTRLDNSREFTNGIPEKNAVKIYTPEHILIYQKSKKINNKFELVQNINVNDKVNFLVSQDVYKNKELFIKKGTKVKGVVRTAEPGNRINYPPGALEVSYFTTYDINGNEVKLYGKISEEAPETGIFMMLITGTPSINPAIKKNKIYNVYYK